MRSRLSSVTGCCIWLIHLAKLKVTIECFVLVEITMTENRTDCNVTSFNEALD
jgi:hypothetical protein